MQSELINWAQNVGIKINTVVITIKSDIGHKSRMLGLILGCERGEVFCSDKKENIVS